MDEKKKTGLFVATHNRIKALKNHPDSLKVKVYCLKKYDNWLLNILKRILNIKFQDYKKTSFTYESVFYEDLYFKDTLIKSILRKFGLDYWSYKSIINNMKLDDVNIVSAHWGGEQGSFAYYLKKAKGIPYTITLHGSDIHTMPYKDNIFKKTVIRNMNNSDAVFFVSKQLKLESKKIGWEDNSSKSHISYNAVDSKLFYSLSNEDVKAIKKREKTNEYLIGFVGNLISIKRADRLIDIFKGIQSNFYQDITFYIIGEGLLKGELIKEAQQGDLDIRIIGSIAQESLREYLNMMDCLILPSKNEGTPNIILESQACGTPVVATETGGIPEIINKIDYLVNNIDKSLVIDFSKKVTEVLTKKERVTSNKLSWEEIIEDEIKVFQKIIE